MNKYVRYIIIGILAVSLSAILFQPEEEIQHSPRDYEDIIQSGVLRAVTEYNSLSFYALDEDSVAGFHYELLNAFAKDKGLSLEIKPIMSLVERWEEVKSGKYDILANDVLRTQTEGDSILFTHPILLSKQVLVQRKPKSSKDSLYIKSHLDLAHKTLHIVKGSPYKQRIENLSNEIGDTIYIEEIDKYGIEQLLALVAHGDIDYAVCDEGIAIASMKDFPQLDIDTPISFTQFNSWGVNKQSIVLLDTLNVWLDHYTKTKAFKKLRKKYYKY